MEVSNIFLTKHYEVSDTEEVPIIKNWLGREGLQCIQLFMVTEQEAYRSVNGLLRY